MNMTKNIGKKLKCCKAFDLMVYGIFEFKIMMLLSKVFFVVEECQTEA